MCVVKLVGVNVQNLTPEKRYSSPADAILNCGYKTQNWWVRIAHCLALLKSGNDVVNYLQGRHVDWKVIPILVHEGMKNIVVVDGSGKIHGFRPGGSVIEQRLGKHAFYRDIIQ